MAISTPESGALPSTLPTTLPSDFGEWDNHTASVQTEEFTSAQAASESAFDLASSFTPEYTFDLAADLASQPAPAYTYTFDLNSEPASQPALEYTPQYTFDLSPRSLSTSDFSADRETESASQPASDSCVAVMPAPAAVAPEQLSAPVQLTVPAQFDMPRIRSAASPQKAYTCQKSFLDQLLAMPFDPAASRRDAALDSVSPLAIFEVPAADRTPIDIGTRKPAEPAPDSHTFEASAAEFSAPELFSTLQPRKARSAKAESAKSESGDIARENSGRTRNWILTLGVIFAVTCALSFFGVLLFFGNGRLRQSAPTQTSQPQASPNTSKPSPSLHARQR